jgi:hypothetical protein
LSASSATNPTVPSNSRSGIESARILQRLPTDTRFNTDSWMDASTIRPFVRGNREDLLALAHLRPLLDRIAAAHATPFGARVHDHAGVLGHDARLPDLVQVLLQLLLLEVSFDLLVASADS